jgi:ATP-dependent helicase YprA (DUF1998 family)
VARGSSRRSRCAPWWVERVIFWARYTRPSTPSSTPCPFGLSTLIHAPVDAPLLLLYDGHEGGVGIADVAYSDFEELAAIAQAMIGSCDCDKGCPRCVFDRLCGSDNEPMDRPGARRVLQSLDERNG